MRFLIPLLLTAGLAQASPVEDSIGQRALACAACHGKEGRATRDGYFPRIAGKPAGYLYNQLINFRDGLRKAPAMRYMVAPLSEAYLRELAAWFADQHPPHGEPAPATVDGAVLERGRSLVLHGDPARHLPACVACHGEQLNGAAPFIPGLLGLPRDYVNAQFGAWRTGTRRAATPDCMGEISHKLSADEIAAISAWLAAQPVAAGARPAPSAPHPMPLACGSVAP